MTFISHVDGQLDVTAPTSVQITIREDGRTIWVNVDEVCLLRACRIKDLKVVDLRTKKKA